MEKSDVILSLEEIYGKQQIMRNLRKYFFFPKILLAFFSRYFSSFVFSSLGIYFFFHCKSVEKEI